MYEKYGENYEVFNHNGEVGRLKLIDDIYEFYRDKLTGDDEDIDMLAFALLEELSYEDLLKVIHDLERQELYNLVGIYFIEALRSKFASDDYGQQKADTPNHPRHLH